MNYFEVKVKYEKLQENGKQKKATETYLVDALSFTEAESRIIDERKAYITGEFEVSSITKTKISELVISDKSDAEKWYKCKVLFSTIDEKSAKEKKTNVYYLVNSNDLSSSKTRLVEFMNGGLTDYEIVKIEETSIIDVYKYIPHI